MYCVYTIYFTHIPSCAYLVEGRELHGGDTVDVFLHLVEEVVPATDQSTLELVVDHLQLVRLPHLTHLARTRSYKNDGLCKWKNYNNPK